MDCNQIRISRRRNRSTANARTQFTLTPLLILTFVLLLGSAAPARASEYRLKRDTDEGSKPDIFKQIVLYLPNRVIDFVDIWRLNAGVGLGFGLNIRPTKGLQAGVCVYDSVRVGLRGRRFPIWHEWACEWGFSAMYYEHPQSEVERGFYEFGGTIHLGLIGLDAAFDIEEVLDFGSGFILYDPADDDLR